MQGLRKMSGREMCSALARLGFVFVRQKGSHVIMKKKTGAGEIGCVIPMHEELKTGTMRGILKQARLSEEEFVEVL